MLPMVFTPGDTEQGDGGVPDVTPASGTGVPVVFLMKHRPVASTNVKPAQCTVVLLLQRPQQSPTEAAGIGGAAMSPIELTPGWSVQVPPGLPIAPETTSGSGVNGSSLFFKLQRITGDM